MCVWGGGVLESSVSNIGLFRDFRKFSDLKLPRDNIIYFASSVVVDVEFKTGMSCKKNIFLFRRRCRAVK